MSSTVIGVNDAKAVKRWSSVLFVDQARESYFQNRFMGDGQDAMTPLQNLTDLEKKAGEEISYDLKLQLRGRPAYGDTRITGTEENMRYATDTIKIDLIGKSVSAGRTMTSKRTVHNLRSHANDLQKDYWSRFWDEMTSMYLAGRRGENADFIESLTFTGFAGNSFVSPDSEHNLFGGSATAYNDIDSADTFALGLIDRAVTKSRVMGGGTTNIPRLRPMKIGGEDRFVCLMHPFQEQSLRSNTGTGQWLDIQKAAAGSDGQKSPIFRGTMGMYRGVVLHSHEVVTIANDAGSGGDQPTARALFMGRQAGVCAYGSPGNGARLKWREDLEDRGRELVVTVECIGGVKKAAFSVEGTSYDFGLMSLDTYAIDPEA